MCLCSLSSGRIERSVSGPQEWRGTWDVGCCKHLQGHTIRTLCLWGHIKGKGFTSSLRKTRRQNGRIVQHCSAPFIFMIIILLSPELAQMEACLDENPEFFMVRLHFYCLCRHTLRTFHQTGYWMVFNWYSLCSNWQTELQILHPRERLFCLFLLFSFWNWRGEEVKKPTLYYSYFPQKLDHHVHRTTWCEKAAVPWSTNGWRLMPEPPSRTTTPPPQEPPGEDFCRTIVP